jgi:hypothetical protein
VRDWIRAARRGATGLIARAALPTATPWQRVAIVTAGRLLTT